MKDGTSTERRSFVFKTGALLGAGLTVRGTAGRSSKSPPPSGQGTPETDDREAIRRLHLILLGSIEGRDVAAAAECFDAGARIDWSGTCALGKPAIERLLVAGAARQAGEAHTAYRSTAAQCKDTLSLEADRCGATASFHAQVEVSTALHGDSTVVQMARLQGQMAVSRWDTGRFDGRYVKTGTGWKIVVLAYRKV